MALAFEYTDPLYNLEKNHVFTYDIGEAFYGVSEYEAFQVYSDTDFKHRVDIKISENPDTNTLTIEPNLVFCFGEEGSCVGDGTWGSRSKFWLVQYIDTKTGEELEKPVVTVFSIAQEMNTPTLKQSVGADGYYKLSWTLVDGADYYEVYKYDAEIDSAFLAATTEKLECSNENFIDVQEYQERFREKYANTEIDVDTWYTMNYFLDDGYSFFVVAKTNDGKHSGMSNVCNPEDIMNQIPVAQSWDFQTEYEGSDILVLPAYVDMEMMDGSIGKYLIEYHGATVTLLQDGRIVIQAGIRNLPIAMQQITLTGMDYETFLSQADKLTRRGDDLAVKTGTASEDIDIPFVPESTGQSEETETEGDDDIPLEGEDDIVSEEEEKDNDVTNETVTMAGIELPVNVAETVYANSALSEWLALNLLAHNETISLDGFKEAADSDILEDAFFEAYKQNPLCGILNTIQYDYESNSMMVTYLQSEEDTKLMQQESLKRAEEIAQLIITEDMSDYEKEIAINRYLCDNAEYNDKIMDYINEDGTISQEAAEEFSNSFTPYGVLVENIGVCESYAEAFGLIAREAGLDSVIVNGSMEGVNHEWNRVLLDGKWYTLDVTNNDNEILSNTLCNLSDEVAAQVLKQSDIAIMDAFIGNYTADDMKNEYYTVNGLYTEDAEEAKMLLAKGLMENGRAAVRMDSSFGNVSVEEIIEGALEQSQTSSVMYYSFANVIAVVKQ